jgi:hypothetical protein
MSHSQSHETRHCKMRSFFLTLKMKICCASQVMSGDKKATTKHVSGSFDFLKSMRFFGLCYSSSTLTLTITKPRRRMSMIFGSRFSRDFLWHHILSGKIITFSLAVMFIHILKAAGNSQSLPHPPTPTMKLPHFVKMPKQVEQEDVLANDEIQENMGQ